MPITYFPDSPMKKPFLPMDKIQKRRVISSSENRSDLNGSGLDYTFWATMPNWIVNEVLISFPDAISKDLSVNKVVGRGILTKLNDLLWIKCDGAPSQAIYINQGFYNGTTLSAQIKSQMDANAAFVAAGVAPFTVTYSAVTGKFSITTTAGNIQFFILNTCQGVNRNSTAGLSVGFTTNSISSNVIESDTAVFGLGNKIPVWSDTSDSTKNLIVPVKEFSPDFDVDSAINLTISSIATTVDYKISYEEYF